MRAFTGLHFTAELSCFGIITGDASVQLEMTVMSSTQFDFFAIGHVLKGIVGESIQNARLCYKTTLRQIVPQQLLPQKTRQRDVKLTS